MLDKKVSLSVFGVILLVPRGRTKSTQPAVLKELLSDYQFVSDPPQDYFCQICMKVLQEPHVTECCGQHFCKACLEKWFERNHEKVCPHCREADFVHILYKPLQRKINELMVHCSNRMLGCTSVLKLKELPSHLSISSTSGCGYVFVICPNGCGQETFRYDMTDHVTKECAKRKEACCYCDVRMLYDLLPGHYEVCEEIVICCPIDCGEEFRRGDLRAHEEDCPNKPVKCPFADAGCHVELTRKDLDKHIEKNGTAHLMAFMAGYSALKADVNSLKASNKVLRARSDSSRKELSDLKSGIAVEVTRIRCLHPAGFSKPLKCIESLLNGYHLNP